MVAKLIVAPLPYTCRLCSTETMLYVSPEVKDPGQTVIDVGSKHRIATTYCENCEQERVHVASMMLSEYDGDHWEMGGGS